MTDSLSVGAATTPVATVPVVTSEDKPDQAVDSEDFSSKQEGNDGKAVIDTFGQQNSSGTDQGIMTEHSGDRIQSPTKPSYHQTEHSGDRIQSPTKPSYHQASTRLDEVNETGIAEPSKQSSITWVNVTEQPRFIPKGTHAGKNSSISGPQEDSLDGNNSDNITAGIIPAFIILSVLAVPIVFLLIISISLRLRAYHRDKHSQMNGLHGSRKNLSVGRTRGWWSYMNCCDRQKYKFNRVTLQDFYSDSDSDGV